MVFSQHLDYLMQLVRQLPGPFLAELVGKAPIIPESIAARLAEPGPDAFTDIRLTQVTEDSAGIVHFVSKRDPQNVIVGCVEMGNIAFLSLPPIWLLFAFARVNQTVRAGRYHLGDTIAEPISDILQPRLASLILYAIMKKSCNG
jgi:hypothetical protein